MNQQDNKNKEVERSTNAYVKCERICFNRWYFLLVILLNINLF